MDILERLDLLSKPSPWKTREPATPPSTNNPLPSLKAIITSSLLQRNTFYSTLSSFHSANNNYDEYNIIPRDLLLYLSLLISKYIIVYDINPFLSDKMTPLYIFQNFSADDVHPYEEEQHWNSHCTNAYTILKNMRCTVHRAQS